MIGGRGDLDMDQQKKMDGWYLILKNNCTWMGLIVDQKDSKVETTGTATTDMYSR